MVSAGDSVRQRPPAIGVAGEPPSGVVARRGAASASLPSWFVVTTIDGYRVQHLIGRGGTAVVELALDPHGRPVALKRVALTGSASEVAAARVRLRRESELLRNLDHPGIVPLLDVCASGDDLVLVMPFYSGGNLAERVRDRGPLDAQAATRLALVLLDALTHAHELGIVHRDVTPANVLFDAAGVPALADLGIGTATEFTQGLTRAGVVLGTPGFLAPEVARGEPAGPAADVFAVAATVLAALGHKVYGPGAPEVISARAARGAVASLPRDLPAGLRRALAVMVRSDPAARPSAPGAAALLRATLETGATGVQRARPHRRRRLPRLRSGHTFALGTIGVLVVAGTVYGLGRRSDAAVQGAAGADCRTSPYQPCDGPPAPFTDGERCIADHADYDGDARNGCEAAPDALDASALSFDAPLAANLVPESDQDRYSLAVEDHFHLLCDGTLRVSLTAPAGTAMRVEIRDGDEVLASATSRNGVPAEAVATERWCLGSDAGTYDVAVTSEGPGRSAAAYVLSASGSF